MNTSLYTTAQKKAFVRAALKYIEEYKFGTFHQRKFYEEQIKKITPKGRDPLDWSTEP